MDVQAFVKTNSEMNRNYEIKKYIFYFFFHIPRIRKNCNKKLSVKSTRKHRLINT